MTIKSGSHEDWQQKAGEIVTTTAPGDLHRELQQIWKQLALLHEQYNDQFEWDLDDLVWAGEMLQQCMEKLEND